MVENSPEDRLIVALDTPTLAEAEKLLEQLRGIVTYYKIGVELFTAHGWEGVELVKKSGGRVFLDLKLHDIPNTVARTATVICQREIDMFNVHALGGLEMMKAARSAVDEACQREKKRPLILGVTILTSHQEEDLAIELGIAKNLKEEVKSLARLVKQAGLDGVVSSPREVQELRREFSDDFVIVTPGVRPLGSEKGDQKRTVTPKEAINSGSTYLVIGRPITGASNPSEAAKAILEEISR